MSPFDAIGERRDNATPAKPNAMKPPILSPQLIRAVGTRLQANQRVRRSLPGGGRLHIDRQLPFLCVYRRPHDHDDAGTLGLVKSEAAYLIADGGAQLREATHDLVLEIVRTLSREFGAFLLLEIWAAPDGGKANDPAVPTVLPTFSVQAPKRASLNRTVEVLANRLGSIKILKHGVAVRVVRQEQSHPPSLPALLSNHEMQELHCSAIGIEIPPVYRDPDSSEEFPIISQSLRRSMALALRHSFYEFSRSQTMHRPRHYHELGRRAVVKSVWEVDRRLAEVSSSFDYLLQLTPVNTSEAFKEFRQRNFQRVPEFHYRPQPIDPTLLQRQLYNIPIERVEDPALQRLFREKQEELDVKITMLRDRDTPKFVYESLQLFGGVEDKLLRHAEQVLNQVSHDRRPSEGDRVSANTFAEQAREDFEYYRRVCPGFAATAEVTDEVSGLIVSNGKLLINSDLNLTPSRVRALLAHEIGTHVLTYFNGRQQPLQQLYSGLAGYEELQEGLAVLSEYLVGGLSPGRMRQLAARVIAVRHMIDGADFVETFRVLNRDFDFSQSLAYSTTMRVYRGGGLTKDAVYLRGLQAILRYVQRGGELEPLFVGKMAVEHIPIIKELQYRQVLSPAAISPRYLDDEEAKARLQWLRDGDQTVLDLIAS